MRPVGGTHQPVVVPRSVAVAVVLLQAHWIDQMRQPVSSFGRDRPDLEEQTVRPPVAPFVGRYFFRGQLDFVDSQSFQD